MTVAKLDHCMKIYKSAKQTIVEQLQSNEDSPGTLAVLKAASRMQPHAFTMHPAMAKLSKPLHQLEMKYKSKEDSDDKYNKIVEHVTQRAKEDIQYTLVFGDARFAQSFFVDVLNYESGDPNDISVVPWYAIKAKFMRLCKETTKMMETILTGAQRTMKRLRKTLRAQGDVTRVPKDYVPVTFSYIEVALLDEWEKQILDGKIDAEVFHQQAMKQFEDILVQITNNLNAQVQKNRFFIHEAIKKAAMLTDIIKQGLLDDIEKKIALNMAKFDAAMTMARQHSAGLDYEHIDAQPHKLHDFIEKLQNVGNHLAKNVNEAGQKMLDIMVNLYDLLNEKH